MTNRYQRLHLWHGEPRCCNSICAAETFSAVKHGEEEDFRFPVIDSEAELEPAEAHGKSVSGSGLRMNKQLEVTDKTNLLRFIFRFFPTPTEMIETNREAATRKLMNRSVEEKTELMDDGWMDDVWRMDDG